MRSSELSFRVGASAYIQNNSHMNNEYMYVYAYGQRCKSMQASKQACMQTHTHVCMHVCCKIDTHTHTDTYIYIYIYICTHVYACAPRAFTELFIDSTRLHRDPCIVVAWQEIQQWGTGASADFGDPSCHSSRLLPLSPSAFGCVALRGAGDGYASQRSFTHTPNPKWSFSC